MSVKHPSKCGKRAPREHVNRDLINAACRKWEIANGIVRYTMRDVMKTDVSRAMAK